MSDSAHAWRQLTPRTWITTVEPHGVNVALVIGDDSAALIDAGNDAAQGSALLASARQLSAVPVEHVVITHHHDDHWGGLAGMSGVASHGHASLLDREPPAALVPSETFHLASAIDLGGVLLELLHLGEAHTRSDLTVFATGENVIFLGDLLESSGDPQFDETSSVQNWPTVLDGALGVSNDHTLFVPGHGEPVDRDFAFRQRAEISMIYSTAEMFIQQGIKIEDAYDKTEWPFSRETLETALPLVYDALAAKGIAPRTQLPLLGGGSLQG
ncbi:MAG TPA: MBL fold metallo-hydrolase [Arachnia sp.]|nr:MBL fold metallo-hydrolase [Arachnia sp.]HMT86690.1 MBL fold metallo-hydrolase [Arachnia sp.]